MRFTAKRLSLKKCPPIAILQKITKDPNKNNILRVFFFFLKNNKPAKKEKAAEVSPPIQEQFFLHWSLLISGGVYIRLPPNSSI